MDLSDTVERLDEYQKRLAKGKADEIKPHHVEKAIGKLSVKKTQLMAELETVGKSSKRERIESKIASIDEQIERARWLETQI